MDAELKTKLFDAARAKLRDEFAKAAMQAIITASEGDFDEVYVARNAYAMAEAMLELREEL